MAGAGYKLFNTGDVLTAAQVNNYLMEQSVMVFADSSARTTALSGVLAEGMLTYLKSDDKIYKYTGSSWVEVGAGGGKSWSLINSGGTALTGAGTITISGISGKEDLMVIVIDASSASTGSYIRVRPNGISANYVAAWATYTFESTYNSTNFGSNAQTTATGILLGGTSTSSAANYLGGTVVITGCSGTGNKAFQSTGGASGGSGQVSYIGAGFIPASAAITSIDIVSQTGNFDAGTVYVYGA